MITKLQVKYIQSLGQKKFRDDEQSFVAEGPRTVKDLLQSATPLIALYAEQEWLTKNEALFAKIPTELIHVVTLNDLARLSFLETPHDVIAIFKKPVVTSYHLAGQWSLMLDGIQDPGNMGTIVRIADWFGIRNIICSTDTADAYAPKVVQGSMGSIARVEISYTDLLTIIKSTPSVSVFAAGLNGENIYKLPRVLEGILVIGNEGRGIRPEVMAACSATITIPRIGAAESLNAAVATGIILSHLLGQ